MATLYGNNILMVEFKETKYEERVGNNPAYIQVVGGETKHLALCPRCNNPVTILGIYKKIDVAPHARHAKEISIPNVVQYDEYKFQHCPYHNKRANYITLTMADTLAKNYVIMRAYNYIDATIYIPWYLIYSFTGFPLYHMIIRKNTTLYKHLLQLGFVLKKSKVKGHVYVENSEGYLLIATNYRYVVDENDNLNEWLDFSITRPDATVTNTLLYVLVDRFSVSVDSYYFGNLINYQNWTPRQNVLDIAKRYMNP